MSQSLEETLTQTGEVAIELAAKAREAKVRGDSRRAFFASTAKLAGATALGAAGIKVLQPIAAAAATSGITDTAQDIFDIAATAEALATTFYYHALAHPYTLPDVNNAANRNYFQAALTQEYEHFLYLTETLKGTPIVTEFYFPSDMWTNEATFFATASTLEDYFISAYIAAAMEFSGRVSSGITKPDPFAIGVAVQVLGVECEHRALLRVAANENPANNRIIESALLSSVGAAAGPLKPFLQGGNGFVGPIPMPVNMDTINTAAAPYGTSFFPTPTFV
jgi:hypothetical protein